MSDDVANQESVPYPTLDGEAELFLKTAGGGQSEHTFQTYRSGLAYFITYLEETQAWTVEQPIADLNPDMFQELPTWLLKQTYQRSARSAPTALAESTRSLYLLAVTRFLRFLVLRKRLPHFDYTEYDRIKEELAQATNVKAKPIAQKIPADEIVDALLETARIPPQIKEDASPAYRRRLTLVWPAELGHRPGLKIIRNAGWRVGYIETGRFGSRPTRGLGDRQGAQNSLCGL